MRSLARAGDRAEALRRLRTLTPDSPRQWGRMNAHQMVCHVADAFLMGTDRKPVSHVARVPLRTLFRWIALYSPFRWPAGIPTRPEISQHKGGTKPGDFAADLARLEALVETMVTTPGFFANRAHPLLGNLSEGGWLRWGWLHMDHHLRQFGK